MTPHIDGQGGDKAKRRMALNVKIILLVLLGGAIALFLIQNVAEAEIQFLLWSVTMRRSTLVLLVLGIGIVIGWVLNGIHARTRRRREANRLIGERRDGSNNAVQRRDRSDSDL